MKSKLVVLCIVFCFAGNLFSQNKYWAFFSDKKKSCFDPVSYFDNKAIERRILQQLPLFDSTDFPVNSDYLMAVDALADSTGFVSRWFNSIVFYGSENTASEILKLPFVIEVVQSEAILQFCSDDDPEEITEEEIQKLKNQVERLQGSLFAEKGFVGKGIRIAVFDGGYPAVDTHPAFEHLRKNNQILKTWNFARNKEFVYGYLSHGTMVLSCITGVYQDQRIGLATESEFLLAVTEVRSEPFSEEENWLAAAEWADKNGADIINSSLGYTYHRYFPSDMDGKKSLVSRAANMAASKGILVVNAAGNDGNNIWKRISAPADADSVLTVGGINPDNDYHIDFSSFGPTADKRMKPNVAAFGNALVASKKGGLTSADGTSFASPLVAGFAACAWQTRRNMKNMEMFSEMQKSGDLYPYFDYAHGYGVPQASYFLGMVKKSIPAFSVTNENSMINVVIPDSVLQDNTKNNYLYYKITNENGIIDKYCLMITSRNEIEIISVAELGNRTLQIYYKGYFESFKNKN